MGSVPWDLQWFAKPDDTRCLPGFTAHDGIYETEGGKVPGALINLGGDTFTREEADAFLEELCAFRCAPLWQRFGIWLAVRLRGGNVWKKA